jgi:hypothetical protein
MKKFNPSALIVIALSRSYKATVSSTTNESLQQTAAVATIQFSGYIYNSFALGVHWLNNNSNLFANATCTNPIKWKPNP